VYLKFKQIKVPAELHIYAGSGHGFGLQAKDTKHDRQLDRTLRGMAGGQ
jgi:hypothetical protein